MSAPEAAIVQALKGARRIAAAEARLQRQKEVLEVLEEAERRRPQPVIPRRVYLLWPTEELPSLAESVDREWRDLDPAYERRVVTDVDCRRLAEAFDSYPRLAEVMEALPLGIMRADVCRLLAVHAYGGVYMDLDVRFVQPLDNLIDRTATSLVAGWSVDGKLIANWFFAAPKGSECLRQSVVAIAGRVAAAGLTDASTVGADELHIVTGEGAFTQALMQCEGNAAPSMVSASKLHAALTHLNASTSWKASTGYLPWHVVRQGAAPRTVLSVWRTSWLPTKGPVGEAAAAWAGGTTPSVATKRTIHDDGTCRDVFLGNVFSGWIDLMDRLPLNVMRARMCALTGTVINGGIYMDLDVVPGSMRDAVGLEWATAPRGMPLFGWASEGVVAPWFFAAAAWDPVVRCVLWRTVEALERAETTYEAGWAGYETVEALVAVVENTTGAAGFTRAVLECGGKPRLSTEEMGGGLLRHLGASRAWASAERHGGFLSEAAAEGITDQHTGGQQTYRSWRREATRTTVPRVIVGAWAARDPGVGVLEARRHFHGRDPMWSYRNLRGHNCEELLADEGLLSTYTSLPTDEHRSVACSMAFLARFGGVALPAATPHRLHMSAWFPERPRKSIVLVPSPSIDKKELFVGAFAARPDAHAAVRKALHTFVEAANGSSIGAAFTEAWQGHDAEMGLTAQQTARFLVPSQG